jgi:hypothetical protein
MSRACFSDSHARRGPVGRLLDQRPPFPQHQGLSLGIGLLCGQPFGVVTQIAGPVEGIAGEDVLMSHAAL